VSYILDALKKSEQERSRGTIPDIKAVHQPGTAESSRSSALPYVVLMVLLAIAAGLGFWIYEKNWPLDGKASTVKSERNATPASSQSETATALDNKTEDQQTTQDSSAEQSDTQIALAQHLSVLSEKAQADNKAANSASSVAAKEKRSAASKNSKGNDKPAHTKPTPRPNVVFADKPLTANNYITPRNTTADDAQGASTAAANPSTDTEDDVIYDIADLPEDVKRDLPPITFAGHVYSSSKSQRSVMLNGKKMREGEEVTQGLVLEQITVDGVVLRAQGYRFKLGALQDWSY
jgi:general secretion pathway protein B